MTREEKGEKLISASIEEYKGKGESILVVDDVKEQRYLAGDILNVLDYKVRTVSSGEEAVEYIRNNPVYLVIPDMIMDPGIDGLETYKRIIEIKPRQKAIIVSGFSETEKGRKARELGGGAYIQKPYIVEQLGMAIRKELQR